MIHKRIIAGMTEALVWLDRRGRILGLNPEAQKIFELDPAAVIGERFLDVLPNRAENRALLQAVAGLATRWAGDRVTRLVDLYTPFASRLLSLTSTLLPPSSDEKDGEDPVLLLAFRDISEARELRDTLTAMERIHGLNRELDARNSILRELTSSLDLNTVLQRILETTKTLLEVEGLSMLRLDSAAKELYFAAVDTDSVGRERLLKTRISLETGIAGWVARNCMPVIVNNPQADARFNDGVDRRTGCITRSILAVPVVCEGRFLAVIEAINKRNAADGFNDNDLNTMNHVASSAAVAIRNAELFHELHTISITDDLTGLANTRHFYQAFRRYIHMGKKEGRRFAIVMMDLDNFKTVVDSYGHQTGSRTLIEVSRMVQRHVPASDILCRFGGDEFVALLSNAGRGEALAAARGIRKDIESVERILGGRVNVRELTCSIGIALFPDHGDEVETLFHRADQAMYQVKRQTKNAIRVWKEAEDLQTLEKG